MVFQTGTVSLILKKNKDIEKQSYIAFGRKKLLSRAGRFNLRPSPLRFRSG
jgi:hypothetical protein